MDLDPNATYTAFLGPRLLASGRLHEVALAAARTAQRSGDAALLVFSDASGSLVELDLRGGEHDVLARYPEPAAPAAGAEQAVPRPRGRPRIGVVAREVTLLPQQWEWLAGQPGGASVALRKLVHEAMRAGGGRDRQRRAQERSYKVMVALAGNRAGFEEAARALFAGDTERLRSQMEPWPRGIREHVLRLADPDHEPSAP